MYSSSIRSNKSALDFCVFLFLTLVTFSYVYTNSNCVPPKMGFRMNAGDIDSIELIMYDLLWECHMGNALLAQSCWVFVCHSDETGVQWESCKYDTQSITIYGSFDWRDIWMILIRPFSFSLYLSMIHFLFTWSV